MHRAGEEWVVAISRVLLQSELAAGGQPIVDVGQCVGHHIVVDIVVVVVAGRGDDRVGVGHAADAVGAGRLLRLIERLDVV